MDGDNFRVDYEFDDAISFAAPSFSFLGHRFAGWNYTKDGETKLYRTGTT